MAANSFRVWVDGVPELRKAFRDIGGRPMEKEIGQVHKRVGEMVIAAAGGRDTGVGTGRGADIRPSAAVREVLLRVGGSHRDRRPKQWGRTQIWDRSGAAPFRPFLVGATASILPQIEDAYLSGIQDIARRHGLKTGRG